MLRFCCVLLLGAICALPQAPKSETVNLLTGRAWEALPDTAKLFYAQGMKDGLILAASSLPLEDRDSVMELTQAKGSFPVTK